MSKYKNKIKWRRMKNEEKISQKVISQWVKRISPIFWYPAAKLHDGYKHFLLSKLISMNLELCETTNEGLSLNFVLLKCWLTKGIIKLWGQTFWAVFFTLFRQWNSKFWFWCGYSKVDDLNPDISKFELFRKLRYFDCCLETSLRVMRTSKTANF